MSNIKKRTQKVIAKAKKVGSAMTKAWNDNGDGTDYTTETDGYHSGDFDAKSDSEKKDYIANEKQYHESRSEPMPESNNCEPLAGDEVIIRHADMTETVCGHKWRRGIMPGMRHIKTCETCGLLEDVSMEEWITLR